MKLLKSSEAAARLGISTRRVAQLVAAGRLKAVMTEPILLIEERALAAVAVRPRGRPRNVKA